MPRTKSKKLRTLSSQHVPKARHILGWHGQPARVAGLPAQRNRRYHPPALHHLQQGVRHFGRRDRNADAGVFKCLDLRRRSPFAAADDGARMTHPAPRRRGRARDEARDRFFTMLTNPFGSFFLSGTTNFTNHNDAGGFRVVVEHLDDVEMRGAVHRVAADADTGGLTDAAAGELPDGFISQSTAARDDAEVALFVNLTGGDADATAAVGIFAGAGSDDAGAVRPDEPGLFAQHGAFDLHHVVDGNAFGDADSKVQPGIHGF